MKVENERMGKYGASFFSHSFVSSSPLPSATFIAVALIALVFVFSLSRDTRANDAITIGAIFSQSGIAASHNLPLLSMVQLAVEDINSSGGILGKPVRLILLDNESTPIGATIAADTAVRLGVTAVIGAHWSSHSLAMAPILQKAGIPMISPGSTHPAVTQVGDYIFRACFLDSFQGKAMARFAAEDLQASSAAILRNIDEEYSVKLAEYFKEAFIKLGGNVLADSEYRGKAVDFAGIIQKLLTLEPDVVYLPGYTRDSGLFIKQARSMGLASTFLGGDAWDEIENITGKSITGCYHSAPWHPQAPFPKSSYLQSLYLLKFNTQLTNLSAPLAYDAVHLLAQAIKAAGTTDRRKIRDALAETANFQGATGVIRFDQFGNPENKEVIIIRFDGDQRVFHKIIRP